jgi:hypothetical protein
VEDDCVAHGLEHREGGLAAGRHTQQAQQWLNSSTEHLAISRVGMALVSQTSSKQPLASLALHVEQA